MHNEFGRRFVVGVFLALVLLLGIEGAPARAGWSAPLGVSSSTAGFRYVALATDAHGDTAVAWVNERNVGRVQTRAVVNVAFSSPGGGVVTRTLWSDGNALVGGVTVALDAHGELTIAWNSAARGRNGATLSPHAIRAAHRSPSGKWSPAQIIGYSGPFLSADLRLTLAPDGEVLLTWRAHTRNAPGVAAAWRNPGRGFGQESAVSRATSAMMVDPTPLFDSGGGAHVYGTVSCGRAIATCATMVSAAAGSHRFGAPLLIAPAPAELPVVSFSAPGRALIAWEAGDYEALEPYFAVPHARVMNGGSLSTPVALQPGSASITSPVNAVAANEGGGTVSWSALTLPYPGSARTMLAVGDAMGQFSPPSVPPVGLMPRLRDGVGDMLLTIGPAGPAGAPPSPVAMQPAGAGAVQPSPAPLPPAMATPLASLAGIATTEPVGAGAAVAWVAAAKLEISTWQP
ncbi:MAG TPA: hypothetical protein VL979_07075 [Solirubrobacteraceae bacterium]|nr:hypothetical protein [Solirubrobacteraceae bacterium]